MGTLQGIKKDPMRMRGAKVQTVLNKINQIIKQIFTLKNILPLFNLNGLHSLQLV